MRVIKDFARKIHKLLPDSDFKNRLSCIAYKVLYSSFLKEYFFEKGVFTIITNSGLEIKSIKEFDPAPLVEDFVVFEIKPGSTAMDLGGNIGIVAIYLAKLIGAEGKVYVYEPDPENYNILNRNLELNGVNNVISIQKGIWNKSGSIQFFSGGNYTSSFHETNYINKEKNQYSVIEVPVTTIDEEVIRLGIEKLDLIKIDIEGSEVQALEGANKTLQNLCPDVTIETHIVENRSTSESVVKILNENGYKKINLSKDKKMPTIFASFH